MGSELTSPKPRWRRTSFWIGLAVIVHCGIGVARLPRAASKRWGEVAEFRTRGAVRWRLEDGFPNHPEDVERSIAVIEELLRTTPDNAIVPIRGLPEDALEYAPALLWPRLCCFEERLVVVAGEHRGRPVAGVTLIGDGARLALEAR